MMLVRTEGCTVGDFAFDPDIAEFTRFSHEMNSETG